MALAEPPILVVGDSYAHGDEVNDAETWPARLQPLIGRRVVNAAMSGYGIDQMVLRAEMRRPEVKPAAIIMSFIADDVRRTEMKRVWGAEKPYFEHGRRRAGASATCRCRRSPAPADDARLLAMGCSAGRCSSTPC